MTRRHSAGPSRIPRATYAAIVGERVRDRILDGTLPPGSQLNEMELAAGFGVSRGPVREALQRLIQEGLLRSEPHRGVFVPVMTDEDLADIYFARQALEAAALRRIIESGRSGQVSGGMAAVVSRMERAQRAGNWALVGSLDLEFHTVLVAGADSPRLSRMFRTVISETRLCLSMLTGVYAARGDLVEEHKQVNELLKGNDLPGVLTALEHHFDEALATLRARDEPTATATN